jgi:hypothetical protein
MRRRDASLGGPRARGELLMVFVLSACVAEAPAAKKPMGLLPSGTTTATVEWLPARVFAGAPVELPRAESQLAGGRRLTDGFTVTETGFSQDGAFVYFVGAKGAEAVGGLYRVALGTSRDAPVKKEGPELVSAVGEDVRNLAVGARVLYRTRDGVWREFTSEGTKNVELPGIERLTLGPTDSIALATQPSKAPLRGPSTRLVTSPLGGAPTSFSGGFSGVRPALADDGSIVALGLSPEGCGRSDEASCEIADRVVVVGREGRSPRAVVAVTPHQVEDLSFGPRAARLYFASDRDAKSFEVYRVRLDADPGRAPERLTFAGGRAPSVSADGARLAFASTRAGGSAELYVAELAER